MNSVATSSRLVRQWEHMLNSMRCMLKVIFLWVLGHRNKERSERVDGLVRRGASHHRPSVNAVGIPFTTVKDGTCSDYLTAVYLWWQKLTTCTKLTWPSYKKASWELSDGSHGVMAYRKPCLLTRHSLQFVLPKLRKGGRDFLALPLRLFSSSLSQAMDTR